jgi:phage shock protein PspC (stress-responsive transcriptional regulator)
MKKTLTVNLNNIVFHIDDDAYDMLQVYLADVEKHLSEDERKEVMADIEARIAELFSERLQHNKNVVNIEDVEEIINVLGKPSQYADTEEEPKTEQSRSERRRSRRFYRDQDKAVLGGVAAGLAAYLGWDITLIRIIFVILVFLGVGMMIPIYLLAWLIAPAAITASQRLEMQGEDVTAESIKTEINNVKNYMESDKFKQSAGRVGSRIGQIFVSLFKALFTFIGAILGFAGMIVVGVLIIILLMLIFDPASITGFGPDILYDWTLLTPEKAVMLIISLLLVIGCPIFMLVYWIVRMINGGRRYYNHTTSWVVLILWLAGLFMFYSIGARTFFKWTRNNLGDIEININDDKLPLSDHVRDCAKFNAIDVSGNIELTLTQDSVQQVVVTAGDNILPRVYTGVENGILKIHTDKLFLNHRIKVAITVDSLYSIKAKGACEVKTEEEFYTKNFDLDLIGASEADLDIQVTNDTHIDVIGASTAKIRGNSRTLKSEATGASHIDAEDFRNKEVNANAIGASEIKVYATDRFYGRATGASHIECKGNPLQSDKDSNGGSSIEIE